MKPTWDTAPEWANYLTMDDDGTWVWHEAEPHKSPGRYTEFAGWWASDKKQWEISSDSIYWEDSLEKRNAG